jgi:hypothetical protein
MLYPAATATDELTVTSNTPAAVAAPRQPPPSTSHTHPNHIDTHQNVAVVLDHPPTAHLAYSDHADTLPPVPQEHLHDEKWQRL